MQNGFLHFRAPNEEKSSSEIIILLFLDSLMCTIMYSANSGRCVDFVRS